jgi:hypothetical protein
VALMPRDGCITPADLVGKLEWLVVSCHYNIARLVERHGRDAGRHRPSAPLGSTVGDGF